MRLRSCRLASQQLVGGIAGALDQRDVALQVGKAQQRHDASVGQTSQFTESDAAAIS